MFRLDSTKAPVRSWAGLLLLVCPVLFVACDGFFDSGPPNVILITLDTTRADHLGCYGYARKTSPNIDALARESVVYSRAIATSSWTLPSHASLFTGKFTSSHGARFDPDGPLRLADAGTGGGRANYRARGLSPDEVSLAELLDGAGYVTAGFVGGPWLKTVFGLDRGFDRYDDEQITTSNGRTADSLTAAVFEWLDTAPAEPFFAFLNYFDAHAPYRPPGEHAKVFLGEAVNAPRSQWNLVDLYDAEIRFMDIFIGRLIDRLKMMRLYDNTMIVVTSDHGELLGEHGRWGHGTTLTQPELAIPLIVKYPRGAVSAGRSDARVQLVDVFAMILAQLDVGMPADVQGECPPGVRHPVIAETYPLNAPHARAIIEGRMKYVWKSDGHDELFDLNKDPQEKTNLARSEVEAKEAMSARLERYLNALPEPESTSADAAVDEKTLETLKSLGYVD